MAHNVWPTEAELERLAAQRTTIAHCPGSNAALGSGIFSFRRHLAAGVRCALGTDVGGGVGFGMLKEALQAYLLQRIAPDQLTLDAAQMLYLATAAGAEALGLDEEVGDFRPGKAADFVYLRPPAGTTLAEVLDRVEGPEQALAAIFTLAGHECVSEVRVAGAPVYQRVPQTMTISELNACDSGQFVEALGWIFEHSPWVAERAAARRPFSSWREVHDAMVSEVSTADRAEQLALLRAHPDLGTRVRMSDASAGEQAGAGLDRLTPDEFERLRQLTGAYRGQFGFPFLLAVKGRTKYEVLDAIERRLGQNPESEWHEALNQTFRIAELRLQDVID